MILPIRLGEGVVSTQSAEHQFPDLLIGDRLIWGLSLLSRSLWIRATTFYKGTLELAVLSCGKPAPFFGLWMSQL